MHEYCRVSKTVLLTRIFHRQSLVLTFYQKIRKRYRKIFMTFNAARQSSSRLECTNFIGVKRNLSSLKYSHYRMTSHFKITLAI